MFNPIYDLESLTEEQRQQHYLNVCEKCQIPSGINALAYIWMNKSDGSRNLVLYAKKAATDIIRENQKISTVRVTKDEGKGYVAWIVEGKNKEGRTEIAVGSASTEGLSGERLASAVMLAQTRGTRRMTLQFDSAGLLDESEVQDQLTDINRSNASLSSLATLPASIQPSVTPNTKAGTDVTPFKDGDVTPESVESLEDISKARKRHTHRPASAGEQLDALARLAAASVPAPVQAAEPVAEKELEKTPEKIEKAASDSADYPVGPELNDWRKKLGVYLTDILPKAGMNVEDGIVYKIKSYAKFLFVGVVEDDSGRLALTRTQWHELFQKFEDLIKQGGPALLRQTIEEIAHKG